MMKPAHLLLAICLAPLGGATPALAEPPQSQAQGAVRAFVWSASWCGPCQEYKTAIAEAQRQGYRILVCDFDRSREQAQRLGVKAVPTTLFYDEDWREVGRVEGPLSYSELTGRLRHPQQPQAPPGGRPRMTPGEPSYPNLQQASTLQQAVVRVFAKSSAGSGVVIMCRNGKALVFTNDHVVNEAFPHGQQYLSEYRVVYADGTSYRATLVDHNARYDIAALLFEPGRDVPVIPMAEREAVKGERIVLCGYGGGRWKEVHGTVLGYAMSRSAGEYELAVTPISIPGDSGGPIIRVTNGQPEVVGILWGGPVSGGRMVHTQAIRPATADAWGAAREPFWRRIFECRPGCGCNPNQPPSAVPPSTYPDTTPPTAPPQISQPAPEPAPQPYDDSGIKAEIAAIKGQLEQLQQDTDKRIGAIADGVKGLGEAIKAVPAGPQGPQGPKGEPGPQGPQGPQGPPGKDASNEPIYLNIHQGDGHETGPVPVRPGEVADIYLPEAARLQALEQRIQALEKALTGGN